MGKFEDFVEQLSMNLDILHQDLQEILTAQQRTNDLLEELTGAIRYPASGGGGRDDQPRFAVEDIFPAQ